MSETPNRTTGETIVIGAGLAGLSCAVRLHESGHSVRVFEASDGAGGRVRTDEQDGFLLDRGFQVYLDAYPEAGKFLDLKALDLQAFDPGALVWKKGKLRPVMDVFRRPGALFSSAFAPIGNVYDKLLVAKLRWKLIRKPVEEIWKSPEQTTADYLRNFGFSERMIDEFFRGFYGGIFLEDLLVTSSRIFEFTFKMFSLGAATLPAKGMQSIPDQLVDRLPGGTIEFNCPVESIDQTTIRVSGNTLTAGNLVVATDGRTASQLCGEVTAPKWNSTSCLYFSAKEAPFDGSVIALKGDREGLINNLCVPGNVSSNYAPGEKALISVSVLGNQEDNGELTTEVERELVEWFGEAAESWQHLRTEHILQALPVDPPGHDSPVECTGPVYFCGDYTASASIEGAIRSGLKVANAILAGDSH